MSFHFRPPRPESMPIIAGIAGPTKSGKTYSALRLATGIADDQPIAMINAEGARGHLYRNLFTYLAADITTPFAPERYTEAVKDALALDPKPGVVIIDSMSHMHDGPGGLLDYHESELDRLAGNDYKARQRSTWSAWVKPKAAENEFIYTLLGADCHFILCFRAKPKLKIVKGQDPIELGLRPISSDRVTFETLFTLVLPEHSDGVPDLKQSEMRTPFDSMIPPGKQLDENLGAALAEWARGTESGASPLPVVVNDAAPATPQTSLDEPRVITDAQRKRMFAIARANGVTETHLRELVKELTGTESTAEMSVEDYDALVSLIESRAQVTA